jgi:iron complex outermembrane receptor protein
VLGRWVRQLGGGSTLDLQAYYDRVNRTAPGVTDRIETFDVQGQHSFSAGARHKIVWGGGYRMTEDKFVNRLNPFVLRPESDTVSIGNVFLQDSIAVTNDITLTLGTKFEYSGYTGFEYLPSARVAWQVTGKDMLWAAVSRAVRTPSRIDRDLLAPGLVDRASDLKSEKLLAYELGWRGQPTTKTNLSVSLYYNDYDDLRVLTLQDNGRFRFGNAMQGYTYGVETWGDWRILDWWRLSAGANLLQKKLRLKRSAIEAALDQHAGNDPEYQAMLRSQMNLTDTVELDFGLRAVDDLPNPGVPAYVAADLRIGWRATDKLELAVGAFNLFDKRHPEAGDVASRREVRRSLYASARWRF